MIASLLLLGVLTMNEPLSIPNAVESLRLVENWNGITEGAAGEWGPWQFKPETWRQFSKQGMWVASDQEHRRVATAYVSWIAKNLPRIGRTVTIENVALVYTAGYKNVAYNRITPAKQDYAERTGNIYRTLSAPQ